MKNRLAQLAEVDQPKSRKKTEPAQSELEKQLDANYEAMAGEEEKEMGPQRKRKKVEQEGMDYDTKERFENDDDDDVVRYEGEVDLFESDSDESVQKQ